MNDLSNLKGFERDRPRLITLSLRTYVIHASCCWELKHVSRLMLSTDHAFLVDQAPEMSYSVTASAPPLIENPIRLILPRRAATLSNTWRAC